MRARGIEVVCVVFSVRPSWQLGFMPWSSVQKCLKARFKLPPPFGEEEVNGGLEFLLPDPNVGWPESFEEFVQRRLRVGRTNLANEFRNRD